MYFPSALHCKARSRSSKFPGKRAHVLFSGWDRDGPFDWASGIWDAFHWDVCWFKARKRRPSGETGILKMLVKPSGVIARAAPPRVLNIDPLARSWLVPGEQEPVRIGHPAERAISVLQIGVRRMQRVSGANRQHYDFRPLFLQQGRGPGIIRRDRDGLNLSHVDHRRAVGAAQQHGVEIPASLTSRAEEDQLAIIGECWRVGSVQVGQ